MIHVRFKNLEKSDFAQKNVFERTTPILEKFPELKKEKIDFDLSMISSPKQVGPGTFSVKIHIKTGQYKGIILEKTSSHLYIALAEVLESLHERLRRHDEKLRNNQRKIQRKKKSKIHRHNPYEEMLNIEIPRKFRPHIS
ncbi:MAG: HPF/RaiA family ribosome-associated protein [Bacteriovoracaceae bacterium]|jgi:ribosome-associated translation inhibitor RaiA|nr:HPF/RaiA family ribosome-associated protein [Bacteriovoracaceae bacterium]